MSDDTITMYCKNHPDLRWTRRRPSPGRISNAPQLRFVGHVDGRGHFWLQMNFADPKHVANATTFEEVRDWVKSVETLQKEYASECSCPVADLVDLEDE